MQWDDEQGVVYGFVRDSKSWKVASCDPFTGHVEVLYETGHAYIYRDSSTAYDSRNQRFFASYRDVDSNWWWLTVPVADPLNTNQQKGFFTLPVFLDADSMTNTVSTIYPYYTTKWHVDYAVVNVTSNLAATVTVHDLTSTMDLYIAYAGLALGGYYYAPVFIAGQKSMTPGVLKLDERTGHLVDFKHMDHPRQIYYPSWMHPTDL